MILVARPTHGSIEERHTRHERRYSPAVRSSIGCGQEIERWVRRWAAFVGCGRAYAARRREEARAGRAPCGVHPGPAGISSTEASTRMDSALFKEASSRSR